MLSTKLTREQTDTSRALRDRTMESCVRLRMEPFSRGGNNAGSQLAAFSVDEIDLPPAAKGLLTKSAAAQCGDYRLSKNSGVAKSLKWKRP
jgi:hypothetical protein